MVVSKRKHIIKLLMKVFIINLYLKYIYTLHYTIGIPVKRLPISKYLKLASTSILTVNHGKLTINIKNNQI